MSSRSPAVLRLHGRTHEEAPTEPQLDAVGVPDEADLERWLFVAKARLEAALTHYDAELVDGTDPCLAAEREVRQLMAWCRRSVVSLVTVEGTRRVDDDLRTQERIAWDRRAREAVSRAEMDPNGVERFLRLWLAVVHDAASTGYASVHGDPTAW